MKTSFDNIGQARVANSSLNTEDFGYTCGAAWNMGWRTNNAGLTHYTYGLKNQLARINSQYLSYDLNGNLVTNPVTALGYIYDDENRLAEVAKVEPLPAVRAFAVPLAAPGMFPLSDHRSLDLPPSADHCATVRRWLMARYSPEPPVARTVNE